VLEHQVVSCLLGTGRRAWAMGLAGRASAGERVGLIVAALVALQPHGVRHRDTLLVADTLVVTATGLLLLTAYRWWDLRTPAAAALVRRGRGGGHAGATDGAGGGSGDRPAVRLVAGPATGAPPCPPSWAWPPWPWPRWWARGWSTTWPATTGPAG
jgi:hypothetical protein